MNFKLQLIIIIICIFFTSPSIAQLTYTTNDKTHLWGQVTIEDLEMEPFAQWYTESGDAITPKLPISYYSNLKDVSVKIFLGTWCGDTQNFVPKFIKTWETAGLPIEQLELIALRGGELYKQGPEHEELAYDIHRVPTFIFERDGAEIGRIVEHPVTDLETDIAQISAGIPTTPSYKAVAELQSLLASKSLDSLNGQFKSIARALFGEASYVGELTTYAKKLHHDGEIEKANFVYTLNTALFKYHPYSHYRLGVFKYECEKIEEANESFQKSQSIASDYLDVNEYLDKLANTETKNVKQ